LGDNALANLSHLGAGGADDATDEALEAAVGATVGALVGSGVFVGSGALVGTAVGGTGVGGTGVGGTGVGVGAGAHAAIATNTIIIAITSKPYFFISSPPRESVWVYTSRTRWISSDRIPPFNDWLCDIFVHRL